MPTLPPLTLSLLATQITAVHAQYALAFVAHIAGLSAVPLTYMQYRHSTSRFDRRLEADRWDPALGLSCRAIIKQLLHTVCQGNCWRAAFEQSHRLQKSVSYHNRPVRARQHQNSRWRCV